MVNSGCAILTQEEKNVIQNALKASIYGGLRDFKEEKMATKKISVTTKVSINEYERLELLAKANGMSVSAILKLMIIGLLNGDIEVDQGEIKVTEPVVTFDEEFRENIRYKELRFDRLLGAFERNEYPDSVIRQYIEQIISQINEQGKFSKKRYREDWGC